MIPLLMISVWLWSVIILTGLEIMVWAPGKPNSRSQELSMRTVRLLMEKKMTNSQKINRRILAGIVTQTTSPLRSGVQTIKLLSTIAPLLGLLGTVNGMISTFDVVAQFGTGNAKALASGISEAMVTTQTGLVVAVPGMIAGLILESKTRKIKERLESYGLGLLKRNGTARGKEL